MNHLQLSHAEAAVLSHVLADNAVTHVLRSDGCPQFDVPAQEAKAAILSLRIKGVTRLNGPHETLSEAGAALFAEDVAAIAALTAVSVHNATSPRAITL